ncbi:hypothetical protein M0R04_11315 [Candidatus Dojkabacteria bacterium]|nr:hypothetical protein [Candidatus Dojkabacteria bacterium]
MKHFFAIGTDKEGQKYSQWIDLENNESSCSCVHGSFFRFTKKNKGKECRHLAECRRLLEAQCKK